MIFYSLSRTGTTPPRTIVRGWATTDAEADILVTLPNPGLPSVFLPHQYHADVPQELVIAHEVEENLTLDLRALHRVRMRRDFFPHQQQTLVDRVRFRFPLAENTLLQHAARQALRSVPLTFYPDLGLSHPWERGTPLPPGGGPLFSPDTGEVYD